ncbi:MAG TPA: hypothetical protein VFX89_01855 [Gammaproteobacteria bacterium]|nr:hypothetical protein [Gammaproteobacteria bacterium]
MKCEDVLSVLQRDDGRGDLAKRAAAEHLARCEDCRNAAHAFAVLRADRDLPIPLPSDDVVQRAISAAASGAPARPSGFWLGVGVGAALAAGLALAIIAFRPVQVPERVVEPPPSSAPQIVLNVNEQRDVSVALSSPEPLADAEIRIALRGEIALSGFADEREVSWRTDLDRGVNQLTLPLIGLHAGSGQVVVEVQHGDKRRSFVVDVLTTGDGPAAVVLSHCGPQGAAGVGNASASGSCV